MTAQRNNRKEKLKEEDDDDDTISSRDTDVRKPRAKQHPACRPQNII